MVASASIRWTLLSRWRVPSGCGKPPPVGVFVKIGQTSSLYSRLIGLLQTLRHAKEDGVVFG